MRTDRRGATLPELIVVAMLFALVLAAVAGFVASQSGIVAKARDSARMAEAVRTADLVLGRELRSLAPVDLYAAGDDSLRLRAFRGAGPICGTSKGHVIVRYRGARRPDPEKDSVLIVRDGDGVGRARPLTGVASDTACGGGLRLGVGEAEPPAGGLAMVFETGSYSIGSGALRYRRGAGGRQPLTEEVLRGGELQGVGGGVGLELRFRADRFARLPGDSAVRLRFRLGAGSAP